ncbi:MAG: hypothetical protein RLZZ366_1434 [Pseudomonadota bacterium]
MLKFRALSGRILGTALGHWRLYTAPDLGELSWQM